MSIRKVTNQPRVTQTNRSSPAQLKGQAEQKAQRASLFQKDEFVRAGAGMSGTVALQKTKPLTPAQTQALKKELTGVYQKDFKTHLTGSFAYTTAVQHLQRKLSARGEQVPADGLLGKETYNAMVRQFGRKAADEISSHMMKFDRGGEEGGG